ncbi:carbonic anhydrase [Thalassotalea sp. PLHSN55]|uniref:carbonic anhydrase n=1 Tax=Thalassotalea sp. PLHSN55 TaxID=3435888 RepID=UPI003F869043
MQDIIKGVLEFQNHAFIEHQALFSSLASRQNPEVLFITCSDSRIDPNLVTQTRPGDLFICRNAGNVVPPHTNETGGMTASIEYAVAVLGVKDIVICGHTDCGAMKGALDTKALDELPHVQEWLGHCRGAVEVIKERHGCVEHHHLDEVIEENVLLQIQHLKTHPMVVAKCATNKIRVHGWVYRIETGEISCYEPSSNSFKPFNHVYSETIEALSKDK